MKLGIRVFPINLFFETINLYLDGKISIVFTNASVLRFHDWLDYDYQCDPLTILYEVAKDDIHELSMSVDTMEKNEPEIVFPYLSSLQLGFNSDNIVNGFSGELLKGITHILDKAQTMDIEFKIAKTKIIDQLDQLKNENIKKQIRYKKEIELKQKEENFLTKAPMKEKR